MHGLSTKHAVVPAFRIFPQRGEDTAKRGGRRLCIKKNMEITLLIMENSMNCVF